MDRDNSGYKKNRRAAGAGAAGAGGQHYRQDPIDNDWQQSWERTPETDEKRITPVQVILILLIVILLAALGALGAFWYFVVMGGKGLV